MKLTIKVIFIFLFSATLVSADIAKNVSKNYNQSGYIPSTDLSEVEDELWTLEVIFDKAQIITLVLPAKTAIWLVLKYRWISQLVLEAMGKDRKVNFAGSSSSEMYYLWGREQIFLIVFGMEKLEKLGKSSWPVFEKRPTDDPLFSRCQL